MAVLTQLQLAEIRRKVAVGQHPDWDKAIINAALQAIEDWFEANRSGIATAINTATAPYNFTVNRKKALIAYWLFQKYGRELI